MSKKLVVIFDLDGTLYGLRSDFKDSQIYKDIKQNSVSFLMKKLNLSQEKAQEIYNRIEKEYNYEISIGLEKEYNINRLEFFNNAWNLDARKYMQREPKLRLEFEKLKKKFTLVLLSDAPNVWSQNVLDALGLKSVFEHVFTGEGDNRKSFQNAYVFVLEKLCVQSENCIAIGDSISSDIMPAKKLGMKTILISSTTNLDTGADFVVDSIHSALRILDKLQKPL